MNVELIRYTDDPYSVIYFAGKACAYDHLSFRPVVEGVSREEKERFIERLIRAGHESVLEHVSFTFYIQGISRVASHQLVRHRMASYSQLSHRRMVKSPSFILPDSLSGLEEKELGTVKNFLLVATKLYNSLVEGGIPEEDARYFLPQAVTTSIVVTFNLRSLRNFLRLRMAPQASPEIRELASRIFEMVSSLFPAFFVDFSVEGSGKEGEI